MPATTETTSRYLIDEFPLILLPSLVMVLDKNVNLAVLLQQAHFWLGVARQSKGKSSKFDEGRWWIYNSIADWHGQLPFLHKRTIERYLARLVALGVLIKEEEVNLKVKGGSRTWFSIDYNRLDELIEKGERIARPSAEKGIRHDADTSSDGEIRHDADSGIRHDAEAFTNSLDPDSQDLLIEQSGFAAPSAVKPGSPAALPPTPSIADSPSRKDRGSQNRVKSSERASTRIPLDELSELGKHLLTLSSKGTNLSGPVHLTGTQVDNLAAEYTVPYKGVNRQITPDDLYLTDPLYQTWMETEVFALLRPQGGVKPISRDKLVKAITMGSPVLNLSKFLEWREQFVAKQDLQAAMNDPARAIYTEINMLEEFEDDDDDDLDEGDEPHAT